MKRVRHSMILCYEVHHKQERLSVMHQAAFKMTAPVAVLSFAAVQLLIVLL
jgi:hypothetical protein